MIHISYKKKLKKLYLDVNFKIPAQGFSVLFGPSGAGKSSVLNLIAGLENDLEYAKLEINKQVYDDSEKRIKIKPWQRNIGYVFQDHRLFPNTTVEENILFGFKRCNSKLVPDTLIVDFKLTELMEHYPAQLSGGQKQRVALVRALLSNPQLLILDEPFAALDYQAKQELLPYIENIHKQLSIPVIYVSHDIKEVLSLADYIVVMDQGKVIDQGDIAELCLSQPLLTQQEGASFILQGKVSEIIAEDKLVQINCDGEELLITAQNMQPEQRVRILIHAKDVSLCLSPPSDSSILNCVPVSIDSLQIDSNGKLRVFANIGRQKIVSVISHRSARQLKIEPGRKLYAQFKATAIIK